MYILMNCVSGHLYLTGRSDTTRTRHDRHRFLPEGSDEATTGALVAIKNLQETSGLTHFLLYMIML